MCRAAWPAGTDNSALTQRSSGLASELAWGAVGIVLRDWYPTGYLVLLFVVASGLCWEQARFKSRYCCLGNSGDGRTRTQVGFFSHHREAKKDLGWRGGPVEKGPQLALH